LVDRVEVESTYPFGNTTDFKSVGDTS